MMAFFSPATTTPLDHENARHGELGCEHASHTTVYKVNPFGKIAGGEDVSDALEKTLLL